MAWYLPFVVFFRSHGALGLILSDEPVPKPDLVQQPSSPSFPVQESTSSDNTLRLASHWLRNCLRNHDCGKHSPSESAHKWRPSRLIDVGDLACGDLLRLCESADIPPGCAYIALSHCWGQLEIFKLTTRNLESLKNRVPPEQLTQTFLDAIEVTRRLDIRYLWVDSLCILQDSTEDWHREAALMGKVYKYSHCNIAATGVWDGRRGFFSKRIPALIEPLLLHFPEAVQKTRVRREASNRFQKAKYPVAPTTYCDRHMFLDLEFWTKGVEDAPLNSRGWVVQEVRLSELLFKKQPLRNFHTACSDPSGPPFWIQPTLLGMSCARSLRDLSEWFPKYSYGTPIQIPTSFRSRIAARGSLR